MCTHHRSLVLARLARGFVHGRLGLAISAPLLACGADGSAPRPIEPAAIEVAPASVSIQQRQSAQLTARVVDADGSELPGHSFTFTCDDQNLATVSTTGFVTSAGPAGSTTVRVTSGGLSAAVGISIAPVPAALRTRSPLAVLNGTSRQLATTVLDEEGVPISSAEVMYSSTASGVSVTAEGLVAANGPPGTYMVLATVGALQAQIQVVVPTHPVGVIAATEPLSLSPWGVAISSRGVAYVTQPAAVTPGIVRVTLPAGDLTPGPSGTFGGLPLAVAFSSDGLFAYVPALSPGSLSIIDTRLNRVVSSVDGLGGNLYAVLASDDDRTVYVTGDDDRMHVIDVATRSVMTTVDLRAVSNQLVYHPTMPRILASSFNGGKVVEVNAATRTIVRTLPLGGQPQGLAVSPDGSELYVADELGRLVVWGLIDNAIIQEVPAPVGAFGLALTPDATQIYVAIAAGPNGFVQVYDRVTRALVGTIATGGAPRRIAFDITGRTAIITNGGGIHVVQ